MDQPPAWTLSQDQLEPHRRRACEAFEHAILRKIFLCKGRRYTAENKNLHEVRYFPPFFLLDTKTKLAYLLLARGCRASEDTPASLQVLASEATRQLASSLAR